MRRFLALALGSFLIMTATPSNAEEIASAADNNNMLVMETTKGTLKIKTFPDVAPKHVERITTLASKGFYDGIIWHRVIDGFMAQTGDPTGTGTSGSDLPDLPAEFSDINFGRGVIGMARTNNPNSANSQFFICFDDCSFLNGQYTVWGEVVDGMETIDAINRGEPPAQPDKIVSFKPEAVLQEVTPAAGEEAAPETEQ